MNIDLEGWDLHRAASKNRLNIAGELIASGYDVKAKNSQINGPPLITGTQSNLDDCEPKSRRPIYFYFVLFGFRNE